MDTMDRPTVLVTGFGPFGQHAVNASWEAVKSLPKEEMEKNLNIELAQTELSVDYDSVDQFVPQLWEAYSPKLVIHVGVSHLADAITIETQACRKNYQKPDILGKLPANLMCCKDGPAVLKTKINVEELCANINESGMEKVAAVSSCDAGRFLCEYIFYKSLSIDNERVLFVHVPDMDKYSTESSAAALRKVIELSIKQLKDDFSAISDVSNALEAENNSD